MEIEAAAGGRLRGSAAQARMRGAGGQSRLLIEGRDEIAAALPAVDVAFGQQLLVGAFDRIAAGGELSRQLPNGGEPGVCLV